jgi:hypothetical protein
MYIHGPIQVYSAGAEQLLYCAMGNLKCRESGALYSRGGVAVKRV